MLLTLNREVTTYRLAPTYAPDESLPIYTRYPEGFIQPVEDAARLTVRHLQLPGYEPVLLALAHCPSKLYMDNESRHEYLIELGERIREIEARVGHSRTILVGDLNTDPFEPGMVGAKGLHAVMTRERASRQARRVQGQERPYFYNPMWGHFGDRSPGPPGTYHYEGGGYVSYFWHLYDQVLIRPALLEYFRGEDLEILTGDGSLLDASEMPDRVRFSDHLPLLFRLSM
jgi:hypothetical protein